MNTLFFVTIHKPGTAKSCNLAITADSMEEVETKARDKLNAGEEILRIRRVCRTTYDVDMEI